MNKKLFLISFILFITINFVAKANDINFDFNSIFSNASTEEGKKNIVPTYSGTDIPESKLNANDLNNAKFGNFSNNESANFINQSYTNRQKYDTTQLGNIVDNTKYIQNNNQSVVNQNYCDPYNDIEYKICYKYSGLNNCQNNNIKNCLTNINFQCTAYESGCTTSGLELSSLPTDLDWSYDGNSGLLIIGKKANSNYWNGTCLVIDKTIEFNVSNINMIEMFTLNRAIFDDYMSITLNNNLIFVGPYGGNQLEVRHTNRTLVNYGTGQGSCELSTIWNQYINKNLKGYLKNGKNTLKMRVIVSGTGQGSMEFYLKNRCCKEYTEQWTSACDNNLTHCALTSKICNKKDVNILFEGKNIFTKCAEYNETYTCINENACYNHENDCNKFDLSNCSLEKSENISDNTEKKTYQCKIKRDTPKSCENTTIKCLDGNCYEPEPTQDNTQDMIKAVTQLAVLNETAKTIDADSLTMLNGDNLKCKEYTNEALIVGTAVSGGLVGTAVSGGSLSALLVVDADGMKGCCRVKDQNGMISQFNCSQNESKLREKRKENSCLYIGKYCSKKVDYLLDKLCIEEKRSFCCYGNKFSKIMANASRQQGLQTWGDGENTNCDGIAITDLNKLDFSKIDFSELYEDIADSVQREKIDQQIAETLRRLQNE